jgi:hypothetical protein
MKCNDFDAHIDEMLSGVLHPDANQHMRQCERCTSHYRARAQVQTGLRKLALVSAPGPSPAADRAVIDAYRQLQPRRIAVAPPQSVPQSAAKVLTFPGRPAPARSSLNLNSHNWWSGASAAAVVLAVLGMGLHLHNGARTVTAPTLASAPAASAPQSAAAPVERDRTMASAKLASRRILPRPSQTGNLTEASMEVASVPAARPIEVASSPMTEPTAQAPAAASPLIHLASAGVASNAVQAGNAAQNVAQNVGQSASSTWPGYSNLMYCDPVVCSGPMQVVHIKVPVGQVKPNVGQSVGNSFVNADVVVGPDGVARAIRVAN